MMSTMICNRIEKFQVQTTLLTLLVLLCLLSALSVAPAWAVTPKQQYYSALKCYNRLQKNVRYQKYRDKWMTCIDKYHKVYRLDPDGPWAAAGLYRSGVLYLEMYKHSYVDVDRRKAVELFRQVIADYPESRYTSKSKSQLTKLGASTLSPETQKAARNLKSARDAYYRLMGSRKKQTYRDQWETCIKEFEKVYLVDPEGPHAAESLYMIGTLYEGLYRWSHRKADVIAAREYYGRTDREFPKSVEAEKARAALKEKKYVAVSPSSDSGDPVADLIDQNRSKTDIGFSEVAARSDGLVTVQGLRFWSNPNYTRVVIDADLETRFVHRLLKKDPSLKKPQRLYIDLSRSRLGKNIQKVIPINDQLLSDARAGQYTSDTVRIVVDIKSFRHYKIFSLKNPFRIVLDVWGQDDDGQVARPSHPTVRTPPGKLPPGAIARQLALGISRIVIDPGHGGKDFGAPGYYKGVHEKDVVLQIAKQLARKVETDLGCDVVLTRTTDRYLTLEERTAIANTQNADLFVSIHTNAVRDRRAYGIETFFLNLATDDAAILVAARENATSAKNISDLESILNDLMQNAKINESSRLAAMVQDEMCTHLKKKYKHIRSKGVKQAPFYVLLGAQMPALLVETSFISNPRECKRLTDPAYQDRLCDGIIRGIRRYIKETSPTAFNNLPANWENPG